MTIPDTITTAVEALASATAAIIASDGDTKELAASFTDFQRHLERSGVHKAAQAADALAISVASIIDSDEGEEDKRKMLGETFSECEVYLKREFGFADVTKARDHRGAHSLAASLVQHLHDRLDRHRERFGYAKSEKETTPMKDTPYSIMKDCGGPVPYAKNICATGRANGVTSQEYVEDASRYEGELYGIPGDRAFAKLCEREPVVMQACSILKAAEFSPQVFGREAMNPNDPVDMVAAYNEILRTIREKFPYRTGAQQLAMADEELARRHHVRPQANYANVYPMPLETRTAETTEKRNGLRGTAYNEIEAKAVELRKAHPELSEAQAFSRVYSDPANREIALRERAESTLR